MSGKIERCKNIIISTHDSLSPIRGGGGLRTLKVAYEFKRIEYFNKVTQLNPSFVDAYLHLGHIHNAKADYDKAIEYFNKVIQLDPNSIDVYLQLGYIHNSKGEYDKAIEYFREMVKLTPNNADIYRILGDIYNKRCDTQNVLKQTNELRRLKRGDLADELERSIRK